TRVFFRLANDKVHWSHGQREDRDGKQSTQHARLLLCLTGLVIRGYSVSECRRRPPDGGSEEPQPSRRTERASDVRIRSQDKGEKSGRAISKVPGEDANLTGDGI